MNMNQNADMNQNMNMSQNTNQNMYLNQNRNFSQNRTINRNQQQNKQQLMKKIYESGFAAYDAVLFLDTHPCDKEALAFYQKMNHIYNQAVKEYNTLYGPLRINQIDNNQYWAWGDGPWPWEMGAC